MTRSQNCYTRPLASSRLSVRSSTCLSVLYERLGSTSMDFHEISYLRHSFSVQCRAKPQRIFAMYGDGWRWRDAGRYLAACCPSGHSLPCPTFWRDVWPWTFHRQKEFFCPSHKGESVCSSIGSSICLQWMELSSSASEPRVSHEGRHCVGVMSKNSRNNC